MHYHLGIPAFPEQIAVRYDIPLIVTGEPFYTHHGLYKPEEVSKITGCSHGFKPEDFLSEEHGVGRKDILPYMLPPDEEIERVGVRYLFLPSHIFWDGKKNAEFLMEQGRFEPTSRHRARTFNTYEHTDDGVNQSHDWLKYLKYGYGRASDHASYEIRAGRMTRDEGIKLVTVMDSAEPTDLQLYLDFVGINKKDFVDSVEHMRDLQAWKKEGGEWKVQCSVGQDKKITAGYNMDFKLYDETKLCPCEIAEDKLVIL